MQRAQLLHDLKLYQTMPHFMPEEESLYESLIEFLNQNPNCFMRANKGHVTSSAWIVNHEMTCALLTHHKKLNMWLQLGGHNDGDANCKSVALREAEEESGMKAFEFITPAIFDIDVHPIPSPCQYHYDIRYLLRAPKDAQYIISEESKDLAWVAFHKMIDYNGTRSLHRMTEKFMTYFSV